MYKSGSRLHLRYRFCAILLLFYCCFIVKIPKNKQRNTKETPKKRQTNTEEGLMKVATISEETPKNKQ
jgi:hypothetical protein